MTERDLETGETPGAGRARLLAKAAALPRDPGVYIFYDDSARTIYIGKAADLRARVRSYFGAGADDGRPLHRLIVGQTRDLECIACKNELEALLLENNLIKKHRPRYNVRLRDDKTYLSLRLTTAEEWPRVQLARRWQQDGNLYFGPYSSAQSVRGMLRVIKGYIPLRTCSNGFFKARTRPCMEYEIGHCTAPCVGLTTHEDYAKLVEETRLFLKGNNEALLAILDEKMARAAAAFEFERAAKIRDQAAAVRRVMEKQNVQEVADIDVDVIGYHRRNDFVSIQVMLARDGKIVSSATHSFRTGLPDDRVLASFLTQFYQVERQLPAEILLPFSFADRELLAEWLLGRAERKLRVHVPARGSKRALVEMANRNAEVNSSTDERRKQSEEALARSLAEKLGLGAPIRRIECYDVSGLGGTHQVASRVVFEDGEPDSSLYRRYKLRTLAGADDFAGLAEVLARRFRGGKERDPIPDLVVVDGGKGQLAAGRSALAAAGVAIPIIGLAKARRRGERITTERVFVEGRAEALSLSEDSQESRLLQRVRDEAHRFANRFHRALRGKQALLSGLERVEGVGAQRGKAIVAHFGSLAALRRASAEEIAAVAGIGEQVARATWEFLHSEGAPKAGPVGP